MKITRSGHYFVAYLKNTVNNSPVAFIAEGETPEEAAAACYDMRDKRFLLSGDNRKAAHGKCQHKSAGRGNR